MVYLSLYKNKYENDFKEATNYYMISLLLA